MLFKKQPKIGREAMFKSKPVRNNQVEWEKNDDGEIHVTLTRGDSWKVRTLSKIFWIPPTKNTGARRNWRTGLGYVRRAHNRRSHHQTPEQNPPTQCKRSRNIPARLSQKARTKRTARLCRCQKRPARQQASQARQRQGMGIIVCTGLIRCRIPCLFFSSLILTFLYA